jgi:hypothetical protein
MEHNTANTTPATHLYCDLPFDMYWALLYPVRYLGCVDLLEDSAVAKHQVLGHLGVAHTAESNIRCREAWWLIGKAFD